MAMVDAERAPDLGPRFWSKVNKHTENGCWEWTAYKTKLGYGQFQMWSIRRARFAHRLSYESLVQKVPKGFDLDHICHNPSCVNPSHLRMCTHAENSRNTVRPKNNKSGFKGVCYCKQTGRWKAYVTLNGKQHWLGRFDSKEKAYSAYTEAARRLHGEFVNLG